MTGSESHIGVPAAWYPDPQGPPLMRWWDGAVWTSQTMDPRAADTAATQMPFVPSAIPIVPAPTAYVPMAGFPSNPSRRATFVEGPRLTGSAQTSSIWFFAFYPAIAFVVSMVIGLIAEGVTGAVPQFGLGGASLVVTLLLCSTDSNALRDRGYDPPGWGWGIFPLVYFILRIVRVGRASLWPFLVWFGLQSVLVIAIVLTVLLPAIAAVATAGPLSDAERAAMLTPAGMEQKLASDLIAAEYEVTNVACPPLPSTTAGSQVQCTAETPTTTMYVTVTVSPEEPATAFVLGGGRIVEK